MPTTLTKEITRVVRGAGKGTTGINDDLIVGVHSAGFISIRELGRRQSYTRSIASILLELIAKEVAETAPKRQVRKVSRGLLRR